MKRLLTLCFALMLTLAALPAQAEGAQIQAALPSEIYTFFDQEKFNGYTLGPNAYIQMENTVGGSFAFAVLSKGSENTLYGFEKKNGAWHYWLKTSAALPQVDGEFSLFNAIGTNDMRTGKYFSRDTLVIALTQPALDYYIHYADYEVNSSGQWHLQGLSTYLLKSNDFTSACVASDHISYYNEGKLLGTAYGVVETNLRYWSFSAFPATLSAARNKLTNAPAIPTGSQLTATQVKFTGGQKFEVYSGPGTQYERAANGKATVSTNDWIQVFGQENGYILIQYALSSDQMRFGYITSTALPNNTTASNLYLDFADGTLTQNTYLTDDPLNSQTRVRYLSAGQSGVKWLATMGNWVYAEITGSGLPIRGFVPASAITKAATGSAQTVSFDNGEYNAQATVQVTGNQAMTATVSVVAPAFWYDGGADIIQGYQLYANNVPVAAQTSVQLTSGAGADPWRCTFTLSATLPTGTTVVGLCPLRTSGQKADQTLVLSVGYSY